MSKSVMIDFSYIYLPFTLLLYFLTFGFVDDTNLRNTLITRI